MDHNSKTAAEFKERWLKQDKPTFNHRYVVNLFIVYKLQTWSRDLNTILTLDKCLFGAARLTKNADPNKNEYIGYGIRFNSHLFFDKWWIE